MIGALALLLLSADPSAAGPAAWVPLRVLAAPMEAEQGSLLRLLLKQGDSASLDGEHVAVAADGRLVIGFDRDHPPIARLVITSLDGTVTEQLINVTPRPWRTERVNFARRLPQPGDDSWRRREAEVLRMAAARAQPTDSQGWRREFIWPARGRISGRFGSQRIYRGEPGSYHGGVDVAAGAGAPVVAPADGVVVLAAGGFSLEGNLVIIDHGHGLSSAFLHLSRIGVSEGQTVRQGEPIGAVGATGRATGPHLHWSLTWNEAKLDPERVAGPMN